MHRPARTILALLVLVVIVAACDGADTTTTTTTAPPSTTVPPVGLQLQAGEPVALHPADADEVAAVVLTHDGGFVIHAARQGVEWTLRAAPTRLGPGLVLHEGLSQVGALDVAPDSQTVVYLASIADGPPELFSARLDGSLPIRLWEGTIRLGGFDPFAITPDSSKVVFRGATEGGEALFAVPLTGGPPTVLAESGDVSHVGFGAAGPGFVATADSSRVVFLADFDEDFVDDVFVVPMEGGAPEKINDDPPGDVGVNAFELTQSGDRVVFSGELATAGVTELFSATLDPLGPAERINDDLPELGSVVGWTLDDQGERVVFVVGDNAEQGAGLFSTPVAGGPDVLLAARPSGSPPETLVIGRFEIAPDGSWVAADVAGMDGRWVISAPIEGGEVIQLHPDGFTGQLVGFSRDSQTVVFLLDDALASAPAAGGEARQITPRQFVLEARGVADGGMVVFTAGNTAETQGLYLVAPVGGDIVTVAEPRTGAAAIAGALVVPGGAEVVFVEGTETALTGVYLVPLS